ncbi:MAG: hypothetical protein AAFO91_19785 [Bacteroidota bacterium]
MPTQFRGGLQLTFAESAPNLKATAADRGVKLSQMRFALTDCRFEKARKGKKWKAVEGKTPLAHCGESLASGLHRFYLRA